MLVFDPLVIFEQVDSCRKCGAFSCGSQSCRAVLVLCGTFDIRACSKGHGQFGTVGAAPILACGRNDALPDPKWTLSNCILAASLAHTQFLFVFLFVFFFFLRLSTHSPSELSFPQHASRTVLYTEMELMVAALSMSWCCSGTTVGQSVANPNSHLLSYIGVSLLSLLSQQCSRVDFVGCSHQLRH